MATNNAPIYISAEGYREQLRFVRYSRNGPYRMVICTDQHKREYEIPIYRTSLASSQDRKDHPEYE
jgi:hypothetical protein